MLKSAASPKKASASGVAIRILDWLAPLATSPPKVNAAICTPLALNTVIAFPPTNCCPLAYIWITTYCALGAAAVPGNTSTTFIRWKLACAEKAAIASSNAAIALVIDFVRMTHPLLWLAAMAFDRKPGTDCGRPLR